MVSPEPVRFMTREYLYNEAYQVVEVRRGEDADPYEQYVYSQRYIDAPVVIYRDTNADGTVDQELHVTQDANFNVTATVNGDSGEVVNRFVYTPYGQRMVLTATWTTGTTDFSLGHQGLMLDAETGMYYNRARFYHPTLGRFIQRDPLGYVDGASLYEYLSNSPLMAFDPTGTREARIIGLDENGEPVEGNPAGDGVKVPVWHCFRKLLGQRSYWR